MTASINVLSVSGGKDSTALLLHARERGVDFQAVFADTGHEHPQTYEYLDYLEQTLDVPIQRVRADFSADIARKRAYIADHWPQDLQQVRGGRWKRLGGDNDAEAPAVPDQPYQPHRQSLNGVRWVWQVAVPPLSATEATAVVEQALAVLQPTGIPFLDLCLWKGRFPSTRRRFCTEQLKVEPLYEQVFLPLLDQGQSVVSWQGIRADESPARARLPAWEDVGDGLCQYRPLLTWTVDDVFALHRRHHLKPNPLYQQGMRRVGCMPCIMASKAELAEIAARFPAELERLRQWEALVAHAAKRGIATFFAADRVPEGRANSYSNVQPVASIDAVVAWSQTTRGGWQRPLTFEPLSACSSAYGLCE